MPLTDPWVKLYLPDFSPYHTQALNLAMHWLGLHPGTVAPLARTQLERGLRHTSGRECLPLPLCIGQILQIHEQRAPDEIVGDAVAPAFLRQVDVHIQQVLECAAQRRANLAVRPSATP